jgi:hypothetical protein
MLKNLLAFHFIELFFEKFLIDLNPVARKNIEIEPTPTEKALSIATRSVL